MQFVQYQAGVDPHRGYIPHLLLGKIGRCVRHYRGVQRQITSEEIFKGAVFQGGVDTMITIL